MDEFSNFDWFIYGLGWFALVYLILRFIVWFFDPKD